MKFNELEIGKYYWWQRSEESSGKELCLCRPNRSKPDEYEVRFFNGSKIIDPGWGIFTEVVIEIPEDVDKTI